MMWIDVQFKEALEVGKREHKKEMQEAAEKQAELK